MSEETPKALQLGELLIQNGVLKQEDLERALRIQKESGRIIGEILIQEGFVKSKVLFSCLARQLGKPFADFDKIQPSKEVLQYVPKRMAYELNILPLVKKDYMLLVAISNPHDVRPESELAKVVPQFDIHTALACPTELKAAILKHYGPL